ncbi:related to flavin-containing monooxygenase [Rhynchosporium graminicola]|uniref:Related to flavin-containing monooxygenase n=1 Tax=Rhynchosporium graminicola TaxID=2792576 RepID=A0A1E1L555_9HELO|nr:related to flavin-containing monooxygenase [Rhynchosporium commune]
MANGHQLKSVAIIGAGAAGAITAAAFAAEKYFDTIQVFERRESAGGTWIYDSAPPASIPIQPGGLPPDVDPPLDIPNELPRITSPNRQERWHQTPIYQSLTTNVPSIAMSFSDLPFAYGPFVPHNVPKQYVESYFSHHKIDSLLNLNTTVEDLSAIKVSKKGAERWKLTLRKHDSVRGVDIWWQDEFDAVVMANGHYGVPFIPNVKGLEEYLKIFPGRVVHSKIYRTPLLYKNKKILTIGNSASGHDITNDLVSAAALPVYQSRRSVSRWDGAEAPPGIAWKPVIKEFLPSGRIIFEDGTHLDDIETIIYCTGYKASFPFWNVKNNGHEIWDYERNKLVKSYIHTFFHDFKTLGIVGIPRVLTFRSFEYQAIALARLFSGREAMPLPSLEEQEKWERGREERVKRESKKFHEIAWETGETLGWLGELYQISGLNLLTGEGRIPPVFSEEVRWAIEHLRKYPDPGKDGIEVSERTDTRSVDEEEEEEAGSEWVLVERKKKDLLAFI